MDTIRTIGPDASWTGWLGYTPSVRGPEARRARAEAAGLIPATPLPSLVAEYTAPMATPVRAAMRPATGRRCAPAAARRRRDGRGRDAGGRGQVATTL